MITQTATLLSFLNDLRSAKITYRLSHNREEAVTVEIAVPGERWEVEFLDDGNVEAEVFRSNGAIYDTSVLSEILQKHAG